MAPEKYSELYTEFKARREKEDEQNAKMLQNFLEEEGFALQHAINFIESIGTITDRPRVADTLICELHRLSEIKVEV